MGYSLAIRINEQRKAYAIEAAKKAIANGITMDKARQLRDKYQTSKQYGLMRWASRVIIGMRILNGENIWQ